MATIKTTIIHHEEQHVGFTNRGHTTVGQLIDLRIERALRDGVELGTIGVSFDHEDWRELVEAQGLAQSIKSVD